MFIYQTVDYNKYTYTRIYLGINVNERTIELVHDYHIPHERLTTKETNPKTIILFLEQLIALATPATNDSDIKRIKDIKPLINQIKGLIKEPNISTEEYYLPLVLDYDYRQTTKLKEKCNCGQPNEYNWVRAEASKNFVTDEEKVTILTYCYHNETWEIQYTQNTLDLKKLPTEIQEALTLQYRKPWTLQ
jgi:hypothetical protein